MWRGIVYQILIWDCSRDAGGRIAGRSGSIAVENKHTSNVHADQKARCTCELWLQRSAMAMVWQEGLLDWIPMCTTGVC